MPLRLYYLLFTLCISFSLTAQTSQEYLQKANAKLQAQDFMEAKQLYEKSLQLDPNNAQAHHNLGIIYYAFQQYDQALARYSKAIELSPEDADPYISRGALLLGQRKFESALEDLDKAIQLAPKSFAAYGVRAEVKQQLGKSGEACEDWRMALRLGHPQAHQKLALYCAESGTEGIDNSAKELVAQGNQYLETRNYGLAIDRFALAITQDANYAEAYHGRAVAYFGKQDIERACEDFNKAYSLGYKEAATMLKDICNQDPETIEMVSPDSKKTKKEKGKGRKRKK